MTDIETIQSDIDAYYRMFIVAVARGRGVSVANVKSDFGGGRMLLANKAKAAGMVDRVASFSQALSQPTTSAARRGRAVVHAPRAPSLGDVLGAALLEERRKRLELEK